MTGTVRARWATKPRLVVLVVLAVASFGLGIYALAAPSLAAPTIASGPATPTNQTSATFTYSDKKSVSFQCSLDGSAFAACGTGKSGTKTYPGPLASGSHTFLVRAISGSQTSAAASRTWVIDTTSPTALAITRNGATPTNASSVSWTVAFSEAVTGVGADDFVRVVSGLTSTSIASVSGSGASYVVTANTGSGSGTIALDLSDDDSIKDLAGNALGGPGAGNGNITGQTYTVDTVSPPTPVFTQTPPDPSSLAESTFAWTDSEDAVGFQCSKENGPWVSCASPHTYTVTITNNQTHQLAVRAVDAAGNVSAAATYSWKLSDIDFTISGEPTDLLYPGTWRSIVVSIHNPNSYDIEVTSLTVSVTSSPPGCPASSNVDFVQSPISSSHTVSVPRNSTVTLALADRPLIQLKNLPVNQDVCKLGTFDLMYTGTGAK
ncbi:MAG: hypothetical protein ACRDKG_15050 [Actinomycetota bacterium]